LLGTSEGAECASVDNPAVFESVMFDGPTAVFCRDVSDEVSSVSAAMSGLVIDAGLFCLDIED
jgi:hypothetical protein